jgi:hypothetical protein
MEAIAEVHPWNFMDSSFLTQNPFAALTFIAAPAVLTNATSVLAMSTVNRLLRTRDRMHEMFRESEVAERIHSAKFIEQVNRIERQASLLLRALYWIYMALGSFAAASLVTLLGTLASQWESEIVIRIVIGVGLLLGLAGVAGLISSCANLFQATQLSLVNIREEAELIRARGKEPSASSVESR